MNPAGTAAPIGKLEGGDGDVGQREGKARTRPGGTTVVPTVPKTVVEEPWHLATRSCRPKYAEVEKPLTMLSPSVTQTWRPIKPLRRMPCQWYFSAAHRREKNRPTQVGTGPNS